MLCNQLNALGIMSQKSDCRRNPPSCLVAFPFFSLVLPGVNRRVDRDLSLAENPLVVPLPVRTTCHFLIVQNHLLAVVVTSTLLKRIRIDPRLGSSTRSTARKTTAVGALAAVHVGELVAGLVGVGPFAGDVTVNEEAPEGSDDGDGGAEGGDEVLGAGVDEHVDSLVDVFFEGGHGGEGCSTEDTADTGAGDVR